jgi:hypothetical protein
MPYCGSKENDGPMWTAVYQTFRTGYVRSTEELKLVSHLVSHRRAAHE